MSALLAFSDQILAVTSAGTDYVLAATNGSQGLVDTIVKFIGPIFLLAIGLVAMSFLVQRQMTQFLQFLALAIAIAVLFYFPDTIKHIAQFFGNAF